MEEDIYNGPSDSELARQRMAERSPRLAASVSGLYREAARQERIGNITRVLGINAAKHTDEARRLAKIADKHTLPETEPFDFVD